MHRFVIRLELLVILICSMVPASAVAADVDIHPRKTGHGDVSAAAIALTRSGETGNATLYDTLSEPGVSCQNHLATVTGESLTIETLGPDMYASETYDRRHPGRKQLVTWTFDVLQLTPSGATELVASSSAQESYATRTMPMIFASNVVENLPLGPTYVVVERLNWYQTDEVTIAGTATWRFQYYLSFSIGDDGTSQGPSTTACVSPRPPAARLDASSGVTGARIAWNIAYFPLEVPISVTWDGKQIGTITSTNAGTANGRFSVPVTTGGQHTIAWTAGTWRAMTTYTVVPRLAAGLAVSAPGASLSVTMTGYRSGERVTIAIKHGDRWVVLATATANQSGAATATITIPAWVAPGTRTLRATGPISHARTTITIAS